ncbi:hypothetical protein AAFC00_006688 [Neodothiora populina]|uniref:Uncharacterized protein n=1 Tax=Neodothiora populina TaxID=2781224 RepID=A0ABR3PAV2_9PEZI
MRGAPWMALVEAFLVKKLLESPAFHRAIGKAHKNVHRLRHGLPPEETGGTKLDSPAGRGFLGHFVDEIKDQALRGGKGNAADTSNGGLRSHTPPRRPQQQQQQQQARRSQPRSQTQRFDEADHASQQPGFMTNFLDELKGQFRGGKSGR